MQATDVLPTPLTRHGEMPNVSYAWKELDQRASLKIQKGLLVTAEGTDPALSEVLAAACTDANESGDALVAFPNPGMDGFFLMRFGFHPVGDGSFQRRPGSLVPPSVLSF